MDEYMSQFQTENEKEHEEIRQALLENKQINASGINVRIGKNEILLYGSVLTETERKLAEELVKERAHGRVIRNEITLQH